jgi:hypothetical protein
MVDLSKEMPPKNHNNPPSETEWLGENLTLRHVQAIRAAEAHCDIVNNMPDHFTDESEASYTSDLIKLMGNLGKELERRRKEEKEPFLRQGQFVDSFFGEIFDKDAKGNLSGKLGSAIKKASLPLQDWLDRKARIEREERERVAKDLIAQQEAVLQRAVVTPVEQRAAVIEEVADANQAVKVATSIASAPLNSMAKTTGKGSAAALKTIWVGTIKDVDQLDIAKLRAYLPLTELQKAVDRYVKQGGRQLDGCEIKEVTDVKVK